MTTVTLLRCAQDIVLVVEEADGNARLRLGILRPSYKRIAEKMAILALLNASNMRVAESFHRSLPYQRAPRR